MRKEAVLPGGFLVGKQTFVWSPFSYGTGCNIPPRLAKTWCLSVKKITLNFD
ncbi:hypothetical protein ADIS_4806 [Lunatimonas lonarensis]|uniref:Uncharacterized protein n=1 Tax=Lunatimonas lonarensis TaxID=1232681 RepID=R7ZKS7_9BACT|nr:hypothetical protein ADIS_4806 [Lunatimonas lonarensis]